jgi:UDP-N-acetyl-D-mannosaminuronic acid dehydrogenase
MGNTYIQQKKVLIIGLGEIGYNNAEYMTMRGLQVYGFDINPAAVRRAIDDQIIVDEARSFSGFTHYIICISTHAPNNMFAPYQDGIFEITKRLAEEGSQGALVGIDSTIPKGTSRKIAQVLDGKMHVVHVPHRYFGPEKKIHGVSQLRVIGAVDEASMQAGKEFYGETLGIPLHEVKTIEVAELCKIVENSYRFLEIAFAEELKMVCDNAGLNFAELRDAINTKWNTKIMEPRTGIGGHCLPKDSQMFLNFSKDKFDSSIIETAQFVDHKYRKHLLRQEAPAPTAQLSVNLR